MRDVAIALAGSSSSAYREVRDTLLGASPSARPAGVYVDLVDINGRSSPPPTDLHIVVVDPDRVRDEAIRDYLATIHARKGRVIAVLARDPGHPRLEGSIASGERAAAEAALGLPSDTIAVFQASDSARSTRHLAAAITSGLPDRQLTLARGLPGLREAIAHRMILDAAIANGQFALVASLPALIPLVGGLVAIGADTIILTRNQATLVFQLAAIHGRRLDRRAQLVAEIAPVIGGAFVWRTVARALAGFLPGAVGALPRGAIAFAGTYVVGQIANEYYRSGRRPDPDTIERFGREAAQLAIRRASAMTGGLSGWRRVLARVPGRRRPSG